jgi:hypothetical protein
MKNLALTLVLTAASVTSLFAQLPDPGFTVDENTAIVITDPQNDFLSPDGVTWGVVGESVTANNTVDNIEALFKIAQEKTSPYLFLRTIITNMITIGSSKVP